MYLINQDEKNEYLAERKLCGFRAESGCDFLLPDYMGKDFFAKK